LNTKEKGIGILQSNDGGNHHFFGHTKNMGCPCETGSGSNGEVQTSSPRKVVKK